MWCRAVQLLGRVCLKVWWVILPCFILRWSLILIIYAGLVVQQRQDTGPSPQIVSYFLPRAEKNWRLRRNRDAILSSSSSRWEGIYVQPARGVVRVVGLYDKTSDYYAPFMGEQDSFCFTNLCPRLLFVSFSYLSGGFASQSLFVCHCIIVSFYLTPPFNLWSHG